MQSRMARAFVLVLIFSQCLCTGRAVECSSLSATNISCPYFRGERNPSREYCASTIRESVFWASSEQPFANALPNVYKEDVKFFQNTFAQATELAVKRRRNHNMPQKCYNDHTALEDRSSNPYWSKFQAEWQFAAIRHETRIGLPAPKSQCFTQVVFDASQSHLIMQRLRNLNEAVLVIGKKVAESARKKVSRINFFERRIGCWRDVVSAMSTSRTRPAFNCSSLRTAGFRRSANEKFNLGISVTNAPMRERRPENQRQYLFETWTYDEMSDTVRAVHMPSFIRGDLTGLRNDTTTVLSTWDGTAKMSSFVGIPPRQGPAMDLIEDETSPLRDTINDTIEVANIALLILPMFLALVPISGFELPALEGNLDRVMFYSVVTDVVAVLPSFIKGVELLTAATKHRKCAAWAVGVEGDGVAVIEMWCAECVHPPYFRKYGIVLVVIAFLFMILSIALEILVFLRLRQRRRYRKRIASKWWQCNGITADICTEYDCRGCQCAGTKPFCTPVVNSRKAYFSFRRNLAKHW